MSHFQRIHNAYIVSSIYDVSIWCIFQIFTALNTPETKQATIKRLLDEKLVITDEEGETHEVVEMGGLRFPTKLFESQERLFQNTKDTVIREDDVFLATYPKTGLKDDMLQK